MSRDTPALQAAAHEADVRLLQNACAAVDAGMLVVHGPDPALTFTTVTAVATADATASWSRRSAGTAVELDVHTAEPEGPSWTVAGVQEQILAPARVRPLDRAHIVIRDAHAMAPAARDKLLKVVEEPRGDVLFWFCVPRLEDLADTLRSRAQRTLLVRPAQAQAQWDYMVAGGVSMHEVDAVLKSAAGDTRLVVAAVTERARSALMTMGDLQRAVVSGQCSTPTTLAYTAVLSLVVLAKAVTGTVARSTPTDARAAWDSLTATGKAEARHLLEALVARCAADLGAAASDVEDADHLRALEARLSACTKATSECAMNTHPVTVLAALLARGTK